MKEEDLQIGECYFLRGYNKKIKLLGFEKCANTFAKWIFVEQPPAWFQPPDKHGQQFMGPYLSAMDKFLPDLGKI